MKKFLRITGIVLGIIVLAFASFLGYMTVMDYKPAHVEFVPIEGRGDSISDSTTDFSFLIWNIGYGGLGAKSDFFFDGGKGVRVDEATTDGYVNGIKAYVAQNASTDFILLQEVDMDSKRSWYKDQTRPLHEAAGNRIASFALNYNSVFVPQPVSNPYGKCKGGLLSLTKYKPYSAKRLALTPDAGWPVGLFMLDRCLLEWRFTLGGGKELVVYNLHLSAYDDGTVKQSQMDTLQNILNTEYAKGNYVVCGGDWNQSPPGYTSPNPGQMSIVQMNVPEGFPAEGWQWVSDKSTPTNRNLNEVYVAGKTGVSILDFFLVSPNVEATEIKTEDLGFANSDHQPVKMTVKLK